MKHKEKLIQDIEDYLRTHDLVSRPELVEQLNAKSTTVFEAIQTLMIRHKITSMPINEGYVGAPRVYYRLEVENHDKD